MSTSYRIGGITSRGNSITVDSGSVILGTNNSVPVILPSYADPSSITTAGALVYNSTTSQLSIGNGSDNVNIALNSSGATGTFGQLYLGTGAFGVILKPQKLNPEQTYTFTLPANTGSNGQVLTTDGNGLLSWGAGGGSTTFADNVFRIQDNADATKQTAFEASNITTATTRTFTVPDGDGYLPGAIRDSTNLYTGVSTLPAGAGVRNVAYGIQSLDAVTSGGDNVGAGHLTLTLNTEGALNTAVGSFAMQACATGARNSGFGYSTLGTLGQGDGNIAMGAQALTSVSNADNNIAIGNSAMLNSTAVEIKDNTVVGALAGQEIEGNSNSVFGYSAGGTLEAGSNNIIIGASANVSSATSANRIVIGASASGTTDNEFTVASTITQMRMAGLSSNTATGTPLVMDSNGVIQQLGTNAISSATGATGAYGRLILSNNAYGVALKAPALTADYTLTLPTTDGNSSQILQTNGSGVLSWVNQSTTTIDGSRANMVSYNWDSATDYWVPTNSFVRIQTSGAVTTNTFSGNAADVFVDSGKNLITYSATATTVWAITAVVNFDDLQNQVTTNNPNLRFQLRVSDTATAASVREDFNDPISGNIAATRSITIHAIASLTNGDTISVFGVDDNNTSSNIHVDSIVFSFIAPENKYAHQGRDFSGAAVQAISTTWVPYGSVAVVVAEDETYSTETQELQATSQGVQCTSGSTTKYFFLGNMAVDIQNMTIGSHDWRLGVLFFDDSVGTTTVISESSTRLSGSSAQSDTYYTGILQAIKDLDNLDGLRIGMQHNTTSTNITPLYSQIQMIQVNTVESYVWATKAYAGQTMALTTAPAEVATAVADGVTLTETSGDFALGGNEANVQYTGATTKTFLINTIISIELNAGGGTLGIVAEHRIGGSQINGGAYASTSTVNTNKDWTTMMVQSVAQLAQNDILSIYLSSTSGTPTVAIHSLNTVMIEYDTLSLTTTAGSDLVLFGDGTTNLGAGDTYPAAAAGATHNSFFGIDAGDAIVAGDDNTAMGWNAGATLETGNSNVILGSGADVDLASAQNRIVLGTSASGTVNNEFTVASTITQMRMAGLSSNTATGKPLVTDSSGVIQQLGTSGVLNATGATGAYGTICFFDIAGGGDKTCIRAGNQSSAEQVWTLPVDDPGAGEVLSVAAYSAPNVTLEWAAAGGGGGGGGQPARVEVTSASGTTTPTLDTNQAYIITSNGTPHTLAAGNVTTAATQHQIVNLICGTHTGDSTWTVTNAFGFTSVKFTAVGQTITLQYDEDDSRYYIMSNYGVTVNV